MGGQSRFCVQCGSGLRPGTRFCGECGQATALDEVEAASVTQPGVVSRAGAPSREIDMPTRGTAARPGLPSPRPAPEWPGGPGLDRPEMGRDQGFPATASFAAPPRFAAPPTGPAYPPPPLSRPTPPPPTPRPAPPPPVDPSATLTGPAYPPTAPAYAPPGRPTPPPPDPSYPAPAQYALPGGPS